MNLTPALKGGACAANLVMPLGEGADLMPGNGCSMAEAPETTGPGVGGSRPRPDRHARPVGRKTGPAGEETGMTRPLVFIDFDGVINQFPDDKVIRRQGRTDWMEPDDPRRDTYSPDNWFGPDRRERLLVRDLGRRFTIRWNAELVARLDALDADKWWLSTWQPETAQLNRALGVDWPTIRWYDPVTRDGILTGKRRTILDALKQDRPIVWLDDEETTYNAGLAIQATPHEAPVLGVGPDSAIGIGRPQMDLVEDFIHDPPAGPVVRFETAGDGHEGHWGF